VTTLQDQEDRLRALLQRALGGDAPSHEAFLKALAAHLRAYFRRRLSRLPDEVEDLVQETLLAVHTKRHTWQPALPLTPWVHAIARYKLVDLLRQRGQREALHDPLDDEDGEPLLAERDDDARDARRDVERLLAHLPDRHRLPLQHVKLDGLSVTETARLTGLSESAVKVGVHRGLKALGALVQRLSP
jgi:RNA polymerase sigma-70 factor (ECF subfamily)